MLSGLCAEAMAAPIGGFIEQSVRSAAPDDVLTHTRDSARISDFHAASAPESLFDDDDERPEDSSHDAEQAQSSTTSSALRRIRLICPRLNSLRSRAAFAVVGLSCLGDLRPLPPPGNEEKTVEAAAKGGSMRAIITAER